MFDAIQLTNNDGITYTIRPDVMYPSVIRWILDNIENMAAMQKMRQAEVVKLASNGDDLARFSHRHHQVVYRICHIPAIAWEMALSPDSGSGPDRLLRANALRTAQLFFITVLTMQVPGVHLRILKDDRYRT